MDKFQMGTLDHIHVVVPNRDEAARWYRSVLGFEPVPEFRAWAEIPGGPLHLSADGGRSGIALFESWEKGQKVTNGMGGGFRVDCQQFIAFAERLSAHEISKASGERLRREDVVDFDLCFSYGFVDPYGNQLELNCYDYEEVREKLIVPSGMNPVRLW
jgi:catechol 2,3-dioxygenase-like lactoylglutathione lyase family enzyme